MSGQDHSRNVADNAEHATASYRSRIGARRNNGRERSSYGGTAVMMGQANIDLGGRRKLLLCVLHNHTDPTSDNVSDRMACLSGCDRLER